MRASRVELFAKDFGHCLNISGASVERVEGPSHGGATMARPLKAVQTAQLRTLRWIHANARVSCGTARKKILRIV